MNVRIGKHVKFQLGFRRRTAPGAVPGSVKVDPAAVPSVVRLISYGPDDLVEEQIDNLDSVTEVVGQRPAVWIDVQGLGDAETISRIGDIFGFHPLALEDVVNPHQRPKVEQYDNYLFIVARMVTSGDRPESEQVSLFLGKNFVVTFQERPGDCFDPVRQRLRILRGRIRRTGADYLAYALLDAIIDGYFPVLERYGEWLDRLDDEISSQPGRDATARIHNLRSDLLLFRRAVWPLRDAIGELRRESSPLISDHTQTFLRDCYDHTVQIIDLVETYREMCSDLRDFYLSAVNNRMSEVMKVLTIIATIFIPLSFIAGVYGMNFDPNVSPWNLPELRWRFGYPLALGLMGAVAIGMLLYFRWRRWLGR